MRAGRKERFFTRRHVEGARVLALALSALIATCAAAEARDILLVTMDKARLVKYPAETETVIVGNPIIADVTMLRSSGLLVVTGKGYGETNLLLLDHNGTVLSDANLRVQASDALMVVQRGSDRETYACHPRCEPTVSIGDSPIYLNASVAAITSRNSLATSNGSANGGSLPR